MKRKITLKESATDAEYKELCEMMERQDVFAGCGNCDNKWIMGKWENETDFAAWCIATLGMEVVSETEIN